MAHTNISVGNIKNFDIKREEGRTIISFDNNELNRENYCYKPRTIICKTIQESIENRITYCKTDLAANLGNIVGTDENAVYYESKDNKGNVELKHYSFPAMNAMQSILDKIAETPDYMAVDIAIFDIAELTQLIKAIVPSIAISNKTKTEIIENLTDALNFAYNKAE